MEGGRDVLALQMSRKKERNLKVGSYQHPEGWRHIFGIMHKALSHYISTNPFTEQSGVGAKNA